MSFPTIPDMDPVIDIDFCDAVNLLLASIAMEEMSLSNLMDAEHDKIRCALDCCKCGSCTMHNVSEVNESAEDMIKTLAKLQILLQFKLETVRKLIPRTTTACPPTAVSGCCLMGTGCGCVEDCHGPFYGQAASIHAFIPSEHSKNRAIRYTVGSGQEGLSLYASGCGVEVTCPACGEAELLLRGTGQVKWFSPKCADRTEKAAYTLAVRRDRQGRLSFRMQFFDPHSQYDSGFIKVTGRPSDLRMGGC